MRIPNLKGVLFWWTLYDVFLLVYPLRTTCSSPLQRDSCLADKLRCVPTAMRMIGGHVMARLYVLLLF